MEVGIGDLLAKGRIHIKSKKTSVCRFDIIKKFFVTKLDWRLFVEIDLISMTNAKLALP